MGRVPQMRENIRPFSVRNVLASPSSSAGWPPSLPLIKGRASGRPRPSFNLADGAPDRHLAVHDHNRAPQRASLNIIYLIYKLL